MEKLKLTKKEIETLQEIEKEQDRQTREIKTHLQKNNISIVLFCEIKNKIVDIWNSYKGKQAGDKTREKIKQEIEQAFDNEIFFYIHTNNTFFITIREETKKFNYYLTDSIEITSNSFDIKFLIDNKIQEINADNLRIKQQQYINNLDDAIEELKQAHQKALKLQDELLELHKKVNTVTNHSFNFIKYEYIVKNWII